MPFLAKFKSLLVSYLFANLCQWAFRGICEDKWQYLYRQ